MAIGWRLKTYLARQGIFSATGLQKHITKNTGVVISLQNLCNYVNGQPRSIRLKTLEILCTALECELSAFCTVKPGKMDPQNVRKLSYLTTPVSKRNLHRFPDPEDYTLGKP